ncbi:MAG: hypothetical protein R3F56_23545 [Planctomycetota bacterium]
MNHHTDTNHGLSLARLAACAAAACLTVALTAAPQVPSIRRADDAKDVVVPLGRPLAQAILVGARAAGPIQIAGVEGALEIEPATLVLLQGREALTSLAARLLTESESAAMVYQVLHGGDAPQLSAARPVAPRLLDEARCRDIARVFLSRMEGNGAGMQPVGPGEPLYRPDLPSVAYYEFRTEPTGYIIVATGHHDHPIPLWGHDGNSPRRLLAERAGAAAGAIARSYMVGTAALVAEDVGGNVVSVLGTLPEVGDQPGTAPARTRSWRDFKADSLADRARSASLEADRHGAAWRALDRLQMSTPMGITVRYVENWTREVRLGNGAVDYNESLRQSEAEQCKYGQYQGGYGCASGCSPTAWAMLIGWADRRAHAGDARWAGLRGLFRWGGYTFTDPSAIAPDYVDQRNWHPWSEPVQNLVDYLRVLMGTFCSGREGATPTGNVLDVDPYLRLQGASAGGWYSSAGNYSNTHRDWAIAAIQGGQPAVVSHDHHSEVALGYKSLRYFENGVEIDRTFEHFYMNRGWGGVFAWVAAASTAAATLTPGNMLEEWIERCRCECSVSFLGADGYWRAIPRGGRPVRIPVRDGHVFWRCGTSTEYASTYGSATWLEVWRPDTFPQGVIFIQALR